jgi:multidrug efflux pump subunit AcrA (membrane-fusion protein)
VHLGDSAQIVLNAYPERMIPGRISNIGAVMDPNIRTAKVRIEVKNPGMMRIGMFATATFHGQKRETHTQVPASAIMHSRSGLGVRAHPGQKVPPRRGSRRSQFAEPDAGNLRVCSRASRW